MEMTNQRILNSLVYILNVSDWWPQTSRELFNHYIPGVPGDVDPSPQQMSTDCGR